MWVYLTRTDRGYMRHQGRPEPLSKPFSINGRKQYYNYITDREGRCCSGIFVNSPNLIEMNPGDPPVLVLLNVVEVLSNELKSEEYEV